jgi:hypothetical protein
VIDALAGGMLVGVFALWPVFFHGLPLVNSRAWLCVLYAGIVVLLTAMSLTAFVLVESFQATFVEQIGAWLLSVLLAVVGGGAIRIAWSRLEGRIPWRQTSESE